MSRPGGDSSVEAVSADRRIDRERLLSLILIVAVAIAAVAVVLEARATVRTVAAPEGRSWGATIAAVAASQGVNPAVLSRIVALVPEHARYDVELGPALAGTARARSFIALLRGRLLPRVQVAPANARWHIVWGAPRPGCCRVSNAGLVHHGEPPVLVAVGG